MSRDEKFLSLTFSDFTIDPSILILQDPGYIMAKAFGKTGDDIARGIKQTAGDGYIIAGKSHRVIEILPIFMSEFSLSNNMDVTGNHGILLQHI